MNHGGAISLRVRSEKDSRAEDALKRSDQPSVLGTALLYAERIEHLGGAVERDPRRLLPNCHCCEKDRNKAILSPRQSVAGVTGDLEHESPVPALVEEASGLWTLHRGGRRVQKAAMRSPGSVLRSTLLPDHLYRVRLAQFPFGDNQFRVLATQQIAGPLQTQIPGRGVVECVL